MWYPIRNPKIHTIQRIVNYIEEHRDDLEPFMEDEEKFDHVSHLYTHQINKIGIPFYSHSI